MAGFRERERGHFPLQDIRSVVNLFRDQLENNDQPNLSLLSIVLGVIENTLTVNRSVPQNLNEHNRSLEPIFPVVQLSTVEALYQRFVAQIKANVDLSSHDSPHTTRELVKRVSDVVWGQLTRGHYKDKAHLQSLYSYLTGNKLDCFGVALCVVAACQVLQLNDVHLALSEDHAWVVFGENASETAEVTWHGKGNEDKRGQPINTGVAEKSWLYLCGHAVHCTRAMEVAAVVSSINPAINATTDSIEMASLQQELLWLLYDTGHLERYPMAIGNLGELEAVYPTQSRPDSYVLFQKAVDAAHTYYDDHHVYPHTSMGNYCYRHTRYKDAILSWSKAADVIRKYNYTRDDEEIYKEFLEIANEMIPALVKQCGERGEAAMLDDPQCYALLLQFYDGICEWEEDSSTPVLHVGWAKHLVYSLSKFRALAREAIDLQGDSDDEDGMKSENDEEEGIELKEESDKDKENEDVSSPRKKIIPRMPRLRRNSDTKTTIKRKRTKSKSLTSEVDEKHLDENKNGQKLDELKGQSNGKRNGDIEEQQIKSTIEELESKVEADSQDGISNPNIDALAKACGESILNPDYLLSGGEPFTSTTSLSTATTSANTNPSVTSTVTLTTSSHNRPYSSQSMDTCVDYKEFLSSKSNHSPFGGMTMDSMLKAESPADMMLCKTQCRPDNVHTPAEMDTGSPGVIGALADPIIASPQLHLKSAKMRALGKLLTSEKLNGSAIKLQLTAQSQVQLKHSTISSEYGYGSSRKRTRRE